LFPKSPNFAHRFLDL